MFMLPRRIWGWAWASESMMSGEVLAGVVLGDALNFFGELVVDEEGGVAGHDVAEGDGDFVEEVGHAFAVGALPTWRAWPMAHDLGSRASWPRWPWPGCARSRRNETAY